MSDVVRFPHRKQSEKKSAAERLRRSLTKWTEIRNPDGHALWPQWKIGSVDVALHRPNETFQDGRWHLDIWTKEKKVLNMDWGSGGEINIVSFHRGAWETELLGIIEEPSDRIVKMAELE